MKMIIFINGTRSDYLVRDIHFYRDKILFPRDNLSIPLTWLIILTIEYCNTSIKRLPRINTPPYF